MNIEDMIVISVDDHLVEPPSLGDYFADHVPARYRERVPRVVRHPDGTDAWAIEGREISTFGLNAVQGRRKETWGHDPRSFTEVRPGNYDVHERVRDMDVNGVLASMNFSSWPGLGGQFFVANTDTDYASAMIRAYNDWHIEEWCGSHPGRFIPIGLSGFALGPDWMAAEIRRLAARGCHAISFHPETHRFGLPDLHGDEWDPAWRACEETGTVMVFHFGGMPHFMPRAHVNQISHSMPFQTAIFAAELLWSPIFQKFPAVKIALAEGSIGWVPYFLERADDVLDRQEWSGAREYFDGRKPSDVFREHTLFCFISDVTGLRTRHQIGVDQIAFEVDYPHSDSVWPRSPEILMEGFVEAGVPADEIHKITWQNACRWFGFDPFEHRSRELSTVGALRAQAADVDTTPRDYGDGSAAGHEFANTITEFMNGGWVLSRAT
jgi:predicted TIM-barrel fold metal-dependent hydrolase